MDEKQKRQQIERYLRGEKKMVGREEQKRRQAASAERRQARGGRRPRRRDWDDEEEDVAAFEKIQKTPRAPVRAGPRRSVDELAALPRATVMAVHQGRVTLDFRDEAIGDTAIGDTARVAGHLLTDPEFRLAVGDEVWFEATDGPRGSRGSWIDGPACRVPIPATRIARSCSRPTSTSP